MDVTIITTSLEALMHRAVSTTSSVPDTASVEAFCVVMCKEQDGPFIASRIIAQKMQSDSPKIAMHALHVLDTCMKKCGQPFHSEIGKFKFLNELVKLVSPKYLGNRTPPPIKDKILQSMYSWTVDYPKETKIREAYEMLRKQGVLKDDVPSLLVTKEDSADLNNKSKNIVFEDEEKSKMLKKLLQSKNPDDLLAANRLIKTMVREDERRVEMVHKRLSDLSTVNNNITLLSEMLDQYRKGVASDDELQLIRELHASCQRLQPTVYRLAQETQNQEELLTRTNVEGMKNMGHFRSLKKQFDEILHTSDELTQVFQKFQTVIIEGHQIKEEVVTINESKVVAPSLLDLSAGDVTETVATTVPVSVTETGPSKVDETTKRTDMELLGDIFSSLDSNVPIADEVLKPISLHTPAKDDISEDDIKVIKLTALDELDLLGESLLKQSLPGNSKVVSFNKVTEKIPMNLLTAKPAVSLNNTLLATTTTSQAQSLDLSFLIGDSIKQNEIFIKKNSELKAADRIKQDSNLVNGDDLMVE